MRVLVPAALILLSACLPHRIPREAPTDFVQLDILRSHPGAEKLYVQARLPDGQYGLFMVDTGAGISAITQEVADRLGIQGTDTGRNLQGLGGEARLIQGTLENLDFKGLHMGPIEVAIGVPGMPTHAGWMPIDGILGNNVWGQLVLGVDYPADVLELARPGGIQLPESAQEMHFDGHHIVVETQIAAGSTPTDDSNPLDTRSVYLELDTGARGILLSGSAGEGFQAISTEGEEPIFGIGASEDVPVSAFYRHTRHVPIRSIALGGVTIESVSTATWINYGRGPRVGPSDLKGLIGHSVLADHKLLIDFPNRKLALVPSTRAPRANNGHATLLAQDQRRYGRRKDRGLFRAKMRLAQDDNSGAESDLNRYLRKNPGNAEALALLARIHRVRGDIDGYQAVLAQISPKKMAEESELVAAVNTLLLGQEEDAAEALVKEAVVLAPNEAESHIALFELQMHKGDYLQAHKALKEARRLKENPDAFLMHRSRLALRQNDTYGVLSHLRRRLALYPSDGFALWAYALSYYQNLDATTGYFGTYKNDTVTALNRLHPDNRPLDFHAGILATEGDAVASKALAAAGIKRDCEESSEPQEFANCRAWYLAMGHMELNRALTLVDQALTIDPHRPDFLDTKAVVHLHRQEWAEAEAAAVEAIRLNPADVYHLWQLDRIRVIRQNQRSSP
jgi:tetratricopeptide (TPR) repeat protein